MDKDGFIVVNKPSGITSFDVIRQVKRVYGFKKIGHAGTLDPQAEGVLIILIGKATKLSAKFMDTQKEYIARLTLGIRTDSADGDGEIICRESIPDLEQKKIESVLKYFIGEIEQIPPMYSSLKKNGKPLYEYARKGLTLPREARKINIYGIQLLNVNLPDFSFKVQCSKGTYIRVLCEDIAEKLGTVGYLSSLTRTRSGNIRIEDSVKLQDLNKDNLDDIFRPMPLTRKED